MSPNNDSEGPSLTEKQSSGGDTARIGFRFQDDILLAYLPYWLSLEGFTEVVSEAVGDIEAKFFAPGKGFVREFIEVKDKMLAPSDFWKEIDRFLEVHEKAPGSYRWFALVSRGLSKDLHPLHNTLRRTRRPYGFYDDGSAIREASYRDFEKRVTDMGRAVDDARFLFEHVLIRSDVSASPGDMALFVSAIREHLPHFLALPVMRIQEIVLALRDLLRRKDIKPIPRLEIESCIGSIPGAAELLESVPLRINIQHDKELEVGKNLVFEWEQFFAGGGMRFPAPEAWDRSMVAVLMQTRDWIERWRRRKRILLTGEHRLSTFMAIGSVFSAVAGFAVDFEYRGSIWSTDNHATADTPLYKWRSEFLNQGPCAEIAVSACVMRDIRNEVCDDLAIRGLANIPVLHLAGTEPIVSAPQANNAVQAAKDEIVDATRGARARLMHLYVAGPAVLALFLAHRLNGTCEAQIYQWQSDTNSYIPSCRLPF